MVKLTLRTKITLYHPTNDNEDGEDDHENDEDEDDDHEDGDAWYPTDLTTQPSSRESMTSSLILASSPSNSSHLDLIVIILIKAKALQNTPLRIFLCAEQRHHKLLFLCELGKLSIVHCLKRVFPHGSAHPEAKK